MLKANRDYDLCNTLMDMQVLVRRIMREEKGENDNDRDIQYTH